MNAFPIISILTALPVLGAIVLLLIGDRNKNVTRWTAIGFSLGLRRLQEKRFLQAKEHPQRVARPDTASVFSSSLLQSPPMPRQRSVPTPDGGYSSFSPFSDPILSDVSCTAPGDGGDEGGSADGAFASSGASGVTLSRNVADGTKNRLPVTGRLKSSSRS